MTHPTNDPLPTKRRNLKEVIADWLIDRLELAMRLQQRINDNERRRMYRKGKEEQRRQQETPPAKPLQARIWLERASARPLAQEEPSPPYLSESELEQREEPPHFMDTGMVQAVQKAYRQPDRAAGDLRRAVQEQKMRLRHQPGRP